MQNNTTLAGGTRRKQRCRLPNKDSDSGSDIYQGEDYTLLAKCETCRRFDRTLIFDVLNKVDHQNISKDKLGIGLRTLYYLKYTKLVNRVQVWSLSTKCFVFFL